MLSVHCKLQGEQPGSDPTVCEEFMFAIAMYPKLQVYSAPRLCCNKGTWDTAPGKETTAVEECTKNALDQ